MLAIWLILTLVLAALLTWRLLSGRLIGHGSMLCLGVILYCLAPFVAYGANLYEGGPGEDLWMAAFQGIYEHSPLIMAMLLLVAGAYLAGQAIGQSIRPIQFFDCSLPRRQGLALLVLLALAWVYFLIQARELLLEGYLLGYRPDLMGPLATVNLCALLIYLNFAQQGAESRAISRGYLALLAANSLALLSMGGRLYVMSTLLGILLQWLNSPRGRKPSVRLSGALIILGAVLLLALIGIWRVGDDDRGLTLTQILLAEPVLTSVSLGSLMDCPLVGLVNSPDNYLSSLINFIPSALLPNKEQWLLDLDPTGNCLASPFGATHIGVALFVNFGVIGAAVVTACFAVLLDVFNSRPGNWLYVYLCSLLPFMLFRDGFLIFNKAFFASGILFAVLLVSIGRWRAWQTNTALT